MNNYMPSDEAFALIEKFEGCRLSAYLDSVGIPTIGYGHTQGVRMGATCTRAQADKWLRDDAGFAAAAVNAMVTVEITQNMFDALTSFVFNLGATSLRNSTLLKKLNAADYSGAADEFLRWNHAGGLVLDGLTNRRIAEKTLFEKEENHAGVVQVEVGGSVEKPDGLVQRCIALIASIFGQHR